MQLQRRFQILLQGEKCEDFGGRKGYENPNLSSEEEVGRGIVSRNQNRGGLRPSDIAAAIEMETLISFSQVVSKKRAMGKLLKLRFMFTALCRKYLEFSFSQIAKLLGGKDHTTVVYYEKKHKEQLMDPEYAEQYNQIEKNVQDILEQKRKSEDGYGKE